MERIPIVVFAPTFPPAVRGGGPIRSTFLAATTAPLWTDVSVVTRDRDLGSSTRLDVPRGAWGSIASIAVRYVDTHSLRDCLLAIHSVRTRRPRIIYINSYFDVAASLLPQLLAAMGAFGRQATVVVAVRGEFAEQAIRIKHWKKRPYIKAYRLLRLNRRTIWHATSDLEAKQIATVMGPQSQIVLRRESVPVGVDPPIDTDNNQLRAIFLGRLVPIKGLEELLERLSIVATPMTLDVFGPAEDARYSRRCRDLAEALPNHIKVRFCGTLPSDLVPSTLAAYDLMLAPTRSESFGHSIAEALNAGVPVMVQDTTPWTSVIEDGGGVVVSSESSWSVEIDAYGRLSAADRLARRRRAREAFVSHNEPLERDHLFDLIVSLLARS